MRSKPLRRLKGGDLMWSANSWRTKITSRFNSGQPLAVVQSEAESGLAFARRVQVHQAIELIGIWLQCLKVLRGMTPNFGSFSDDGWDEARTELALSERRAFAHTLARYRYLQLFLRFLAGDYSAALAAAARLEQKNAGARFAGARERGLSFVYPGACDGGRCLSRFNRITVRTCAGN